VAVVIAGRRRDGAATLLGHRQKVMGMRRRLHGVDRDLHVTVRAVLESDRARQSRHELAMHLALRRPRTDRAPRHQVADELRRDHVEELAAGRQAELVDIAQQAAREPQAFVDVKAPVQIGIVDQALPAHGRARLLEVHAHDDLERALVALALFAQPTRVLQRRLGIVNRAGADHDRETIVARVQNSLQSAARCAHGRRGMLAERVLAHELFGRAQLANVADAQVVGTNGHK
jgi:cobaltochelatase CobN